MPHVDLLLTNGGYGSIQIALAHGVPVVAIGKTEEKPEIANRVNYAGVGIGLKVLIPTETQIRDAVRDRIHYTDICGTRRGHEVRVVRPRRGKDRRRSARRAGRPM